jgi:hypothetical protein
VPIAIVREVEQLDARIVRQNDGVAAIGKGSGELAGDPSLVAIARLKCCRISNDNNPLSRLERFGAKGEIDSVFELIAI